MALISKFFNKSIQRSYLYSISIFDDVGVKIDNSLLENISVLVKNAQIPQDSFGAESVQYGQFLKIIPILETKGVPYSFKITFEEDENLSVQKFINSCRRKIIDEDGFYQPLNSNFISSIEIHVYDEDTNDTDNYDNYKFEECYLLDVTEANYDYANSSAVEYSLTFGCQYLKTELRN